MLEAGMKAPDFTLRDGAGQEVSLSDYRGRKVVLYFYPKDNTPGCTRQACAFAGAYEGFRDKGVQVIGVSRDSIESHRKFAEKYALPFVLLSDPDLQVVQAYGVWGEKKMCGKTCVGTLRKTFIFNEEGILERIIEKVDTKNHTEQILASDK